MQSYYIALQFASHPEFHMTVGYFANKTPVHMAQTIVMLDRLIRKRRPTKFKILLNQVAMFGPKHTVRVLRPSYDRLSFPDWVVALSRKGWSPHVATEQHERLELLATHVSVMVKKEVQAEWELS